MPDIRTFFAPAKKPFKLSDEFALDGTNARLQTCMLPYTTHQLAKQTIAEAEAHLAFRTVSVGGRTVKQSRRTAFFGTSVDLVGYWYSGQTTEVVAMPPQMRKLLSWVNTKLMTRFNGILFNHYPAGDKSGIGFHSDQSPNPREPLKVVAALSLGGPRVFRLKERASKKTVFDLETRDGQLMIMQGSDFQKQLMHGIPPRKKSAERWSITFRRHPMAVKKKKK